MVNQVAMPEGIPESDPGFSVSESGAAHIRAAVQSASGADCIGIRIAVKLAGCSGYEYVLEYAYQSQILPDDLHFQYSDFSIVIDATTYAKFMQGGSTFDYVTEGVNSGVKIHNPNVGSECGCGESFQLVDKS